MVGHRVHVINTSDMMSISILKQYDITDLPCLTYEIIRTFFFNHLTTRKAAIFDRQNLVENSYFRPLTVEINYFRPEKVGRI